MDSAVFDSGAPRLTPAGLPSKEVARRRDALCHGAIMQWAIEPTGSLNSHVMKSLPRRVFNWRRNSPGAGRETAALPAPEGRRHIAGSDQGSRAWIDAKRDSQSVWIYPDSARKM